MAQSKHVAIRAAAAGLLSAAPPVAGGRIRQDRNLSLASGVESQVHVNFAGSDPNPAAIQSAPVDWDTELEIVVKARGAVGVNAEDAVDALWTEIYSRFMAAQTLSGLVDAMIPGPVTLRNDEADTDTCQLTWRVQLLHRTSNNSIAA